MVVAFDICSSSDILEDLKLTDNLPEYTNLMLWLNNFLVKKAAMVDFEVYKFTGDGWILLFNHYCGDAILKFLENFSLAYKTIFLRKIYPLLEHPAESQGITFGVEFGSLQKIVMSKRIEYLGRPLNIACRLQNAIKDRDKNPQYKILVSKSAFIKMSLSEDSLKKFLPKIVKRRLRNIRGGEDYECVKLVLSNSGLFV